MNKKWSKHLGPWLAPILSLALLVGAAGSLESRHSPDAEKYHDRVRRVALDVPTVIGEWYGKNTPVPSAAIKTLKPNVLISREYTNLVSGLKVHLTFVQSRDAFDMMFHYPPVCYPGNGWTEVRRTEDSWEVGSHQIPIMQYDFQKNLFDRVISISIVNVFFMTDGFKIEMDAVRDAARNPSRRPYGAAQTQLIFDSNVSILDQQQIFSEFMSELLPIAEEILNMKVNTEPNEH